VTARSSAKHGLLLLALLLAACAPRQAVKHEKHLPAPAPTAAEQPAPQYENYSLHPDYPAFRELMVTKHGFKANELDALFVGVKRDQRVIDAMGRPAEAKPWWQYRKIFVTQERVDLGVKFWNDNAAQIAAAADANGVDPEIVVAIIGVETKYGAIMGKMPVLSSLATLAFEWPSRAPYFRGELEQFLLMCREMGFDPRTPVGSYAGAMGAGQFMPTSYRSFAVDGDNDNKIDLWTNWADITDSVAHYFKLKGWTRGQLIAVPALLREGHEEPVRSSSTNKSIVAALRPTFEFSADLDEQAEALFVALEREDGGKDYWIGSNNFWVITRYNRSPLYAMAATELAREIVAARSAAAAPVKADAAPTE
jgi:membrane-bound lytic murein transglycosylase B